MTGGAVCRSFIRTVDNTCAMHDMASSASRTRSSTSRIKRKSNARFSPVNSVGDSSRESSECSGVTTPALVKLSRGHPATEPAVSHIRLPVGPDSVSSAPQDLGRKRKKTTHVRNGGSVYLSPVSDPVSEPESPMSLKTKARPAAKPVTILRSEVCASPSPVQQQKQQKNQRQTKKRAISVKEGTDCGANSILQRLTDGIDANDTDTIFQILEESDVQLVNQTVNQLPVEYVSRLLEFLKKKICRKTVRTSDSLLWLEQLLQSKLTFLLSVST